MSLQLPAYDPDQLPYILCGPIVRRLTRAQVSIWVALSNGSPVTLTVTRENSGATASTTVTPHRIGRHVWLAVLTVDGVDNGEFAAGGLYAYSLTSPGWTAQTRQPNWPDLSLPGKNLPNFLGMPDTLDEFIIFHGSCRRAKGDRRDGLAQGFGLMVEEPAQRPHLLIMSGDQIYADEVASVHMLVLQRIADDLIGIDEYGGIAPGAQKIFSCINTSAPTIPGAAKPKIAGRGPRCLDIGLTISEKDHLWTLAEFYGTYLTVWSDVLWPNPLPAFDGTAGDLVQYRDADGGGHGVNEAGWNLERYNLTNLLETMPKVRKLLANTPTLMIFDDHETTDDWNLDYLVCKAIYNDFDENQPGVARPQGARLVTNALLAYLLFQHWGNCPERFQTSNSPENKALAAALWQNDPNYHPVDRAETLFDSERALADLLGVPGLIPLMAQFPEEGFALRPTLDPTVTIRYDFRYGPAEGFPFHLVFLDERTVRHLPGYNRLDRPGRIVDWALDLMWPPPQGNEADLPTVLIAPAPVLGLHVIEHIIQPILALQEGGEREREYEGWSGHTPTFEHLLDRIHQWKQVIILSGDVHFGYTHTLSYCKPPGSPPSRAVQFVASSFKYVMANTLKLHILGDLTQKVGAVRRRTFYGYESLSEPQKVLLQSPPVAGSVLAYDSIGDLMLGRVVRHGMEAPAVLAEDVALAYAVTEGHQGQPGNFDMPDWTYTIEHVADERTSTLPAHIQDPIIAATNQASPWQGWDPVKSATMLKALRSSDLHQLGRIFTGMPVLARIRFSNGAGLLSKQELFIPAGNNETGGVTTTTVTEVNLGA